jgi:transaldolase
MPVYGGDAEATLREFTAAGIDIDALADRLQREGAQAFVKSWQHLLQGIDDKFRSLGGDARR